MGPTTTNCEAASGRSGRLSEPMNKKIVSVLAALVLMGGCKTIPVSEEMIWIRTDGHPLSDDPTYYQTKFEIDRVVCVSEVRKSAPGASQGDLQGLAGAIDPWPYQDTRGKAVLDFMRQCMAGKGYVLVPKSLSETTSTAFRKQHVKP